MYNKQDISISSGSKQKLFTFVSEPAIHYWSYTKECMDRWFAFMDYFLKGEETGVMKNRRLIYRYARAGYYWLWENDWPVKPVEI